MHKIFWTTHSKQKMRYYRLSEKRVLRLLRKPDRKEEGIVEGTIANMQVAGTKKRPAEIWTMYAVLKRPKGIKIISAWRYPGRTPKGQRPIIPDAVLRDLELGHMTSDKNAKRGNKFSDNFRRPVGMVSERSEERQAEVAELRSSPPSFSRSENSVNADSQISLEI